MVLTALLSAAMFQAAATPRPDFGRYPAAVMRVHSAAPVRLISARDKSSRSALRAAARGPVTFAGHWVLVEIGCGASCIQVAAIDKASGHVVWFPTTICCWPLAVTEPLTYRRDSRLLLVQGELNETGIASSRAFLFDGVRFDPVID